MILETIKNEADGTQIDIFDRSAFSSKAAPFGVRFWDTDADATIGVWHCATLEAARKVVAGLTNPGPVSVIL
jgi:hypothetical protein